MRIVMSTQWFRKECQTLEVAQNQANARMFNIKFMVFYECVEVFHVARLADAFAALFFLHSFISYSHSCDVQHL